MTQAVTKVKVPVSSSVDEGPLLGLLGLAQRAGQLAVGSTAVLRALGRARGAGVVLFSADAGTSVVRQISRAVEESSHEHTVCTLGEMTELKATIGREKLSVVAVFDTGFASGLRKRLESQE